MRRIWSTMLMLAAAAMLGGLLRPAGAQEDGLNLPTELYVLLNSGEVQRYGIGAAGVQTVSPAGEFIIDFAVAPDNTWLAYRTESGLTLYNMFNNQSITLAGVDADVPTVRGHGDTLAWTPDGSALAFTTQYGARVFLNNNAPQAQFIDIQVQPFVSLMWSPDGSYLAAEAEDNIWWIYRRDETSLTLVSAIPTSEGTAWIAPAAIVFVPPEGGVVMLDVGNRNQQTPLINGPDVYALPFFRASDNTLLVFRKENSPTNPTAELGRLVDFTPGTGVTNDGSSRGIVDLTGARWAPDGQLMVALRGGALGLIHPPSGQGFTLPISSAVAYGWGPPHPPTGLTALLPVDGYFLADDGSGVQQVWRMPKDQQPPATITPASESVTAYAVSLDGRHVAYVSGGSLYFYTPGGSTDPLALAEVPDGASDLAFSPDGSQVAYVTETTPDVLTGGIWLVPTSGESEPELILPDGPAADTYGPPFYRSPRFAPGLNALMVAVYGSETIDQNVMDLNTRELLGGAHYADGLWLKDGRIAMYGSGTGLNDGSQTTDMSVVDVIRQTETAQVMQIPLPIMFQSVAEVRSGLLRAALVQNIPGAASVTVVDAPIGGQSRQTAAPGFITDPQLSPDGSFLAGYANPGGSLILINLDTGSGMMLLNPVVLHDFQWGER